MPTADISLIFGKNVREQRKRLGLSQQSAAERAGLSISHFAMIERGETNVTLAMADKICRALKVKLTAMLG